MKQMYERLHRVFKEKMSQLIPDRCEPGGMEVLGRVFQAEKINVYKPEGKHEVGGSIEEMVSQCRGIMGARGQGRDLLY